MTTNIWLGAFLVAFAVVLALGVSGALRFVSPRGGFFSDTERAGSVFSAIGTMFSVLLALVILLSVETYTQTKSHVYAEADAVLEQFQLAELFPSRDQFAAQSQLICYGRSVVDHEWPLMLNRRQSLVVDEWARSLDATIDEVEVRDNKAEAAFNLFLQQTLLRQEERRGRLEGAEGTLPAVVWPILILGAISLLMFIVYYADSGERWTAQALQVGLVTALLAASLLLIHALDRPFTMQPGKIEPAKMQSSVASMERSLSLALDSDSLEAALPCDSAGVPKPTDPLVRSFPPGSTMAEIVERGRIVIGVSHGIALFGELNPVSGEVSGFDVDFAREIARELGLRDDQIEFVDTLIEERIDFLVEGKVDLVVLAFSITPERRQIIDFSKPYYVAGQSLLIDRNLRPISSIRDLGGKRVCVATGSTSADNLARLVPEAELVFQSTYYACLADLRNGLVEAISSDDIVLAGLARSDPSLTLVGGQFTQEPYGVGIPNGNEDLVEFVNGAIDTMIQDGRWGKLYYQYLEDIPGLARVSFAKERLLNLQLATSD